MAKTSMIVKLSLIHIFLHRKVQRGSMKGQAKGNTELHFGEYGIVALDRHWTVSYTHLDVYKRQDYMGVLMGSVTSIVNMISLVLIAFVSISLVVSSIMIGIITYILSLIHI